jgi:hypothetical protein
LVCEGDGEAVLGEIDGDGDADLLCDGDGLAEAEADVDELGDELADAEFDGLAVGVCDLCVG